jgi:uncharacterized membrane protein YhaH (DUF805 family)
MLTGIFSFRGRINRLQYWLGSMGMGFFVALVLLTPLVMAGASASHGGGAAGALAGLGLMALLAVPTLVIACWVGLSLQARRIRDIGLDPVIVMPLWILIGVADKLLTPGFPHLTAVQLATPSVAAIVINLIGGAALCFWPGRGDGPRDLGGGFDLPDPDAPRGGARPSYVEAAYARIEAERAAPPPADWTPRPPTPAPAPRFSQAASHGGFGRRGL